MMNKVVCYDARQVVEMVRKGFEVDFEATKKQIELMNPALAMVTDCANHNAWSSESMDIVIDVHGVPHVFDYDVADDGHWMLSEDELDEILGNNNRPLTEDELDEILADL